jgi:hypothetical protein
VRPERPGLPDCWLFHLGQTAYLCIPVSPSGRSCPARLQRLAVSQSLRLKPRSRRIFRGLDARSRQVPRFPSRFTGSKWMIVLGPVPFGAGGRCSSVDLLVEWKRAHTRAGVCARHRGRELEYILSTSTLSAVAPHVVPSRSHESCMHAGPTPRASALYLAIDRLFLHATTFSGPPPPAVRHPMPDGRVTRWAMNLDAGSSRISSVGRAVHPAGRDPILVGSSHLHPIPPM